MINFNEILSMRPIYCISVREGVSSRFYSDAEILHKLSCHGNAMKEMQDILDIRENGTKYSNHEFDVLGAALRLLSA